MTILNFKDKSKFSENLISEVNYHIQTRGYGTIEGVLTRDECEALKSGMTNALTNYKPRQQSERSLLDQFQIHDLFIQDQNFLRLLEDPRVDQVIAPFLGASWIMYAATSSSVPPHGKNYANRVHVDCPRFQSGYIFNMGIIWTLDEYTSDNGALKILPGSQHIDVVPTEDFFEQHAQQVLCPQGTMIVFNAKTYHRTCPNNSDNWRHSMTLNACRAYMKQRMDWVRYLPSEITDPLNDQARRLIGFDTRLPTSLDEFFLPEEQRLYKANQG